MKPACEKVLSGCAAFAEKRLPAALRGRQRVVEFLGLLGAALQKAGKEGSQAAFLELEGPLVAIHDSEGMPVRKAFHTRLMGAAETLLHARGPSEARPLGTTLASLATAVRGPTGDSARWKPPEVLQVRGQARWNMPPDLRESILQRDDRKCWYCGKVPSDTVDHWLPLCRGGTNDAVNLVCACGDCNVLKGNRMPDEFLEDLRAAAE